MNPLALLEELAPAWEALWQHDLRATPFQHPGWLIPWTRHLWGGGEILLEQQWDGPRLTALLPLFRWGGELTTVSFLGAGVSDYGDCLGLFRNLILPPDAVLEEVRVGSPLLTGASAVEPCSFCPVLALKEYPAKMDPKFRRDLHRARNKLERHNARFAQSPDIECFFTLHAKRWNVLPDAALETFQREVAERFARLGLLRLHTLYIDDAPAAAVFAIAAHGTLYCYLSAFDAAFQKLSPGVVLLAHAIEAAREEGCHSVDFLRGQESYKYLWGAKDSATFRVRAGKKSAESRVPAA